MRRCTAAAMRRGTPSWRLWTAAALLALLYAAVPRAQARAQGPDTHYEDGGHGWKKFGDRCDISSECGFAGAFCNPTTRTCQCTHDLPITNHIDKCGTVASFNESCFFNEQCEATFYQMECRDGRCICRFEMTPETKPDGTLICIARNEPPASLQYVDPAMIGVLVGMALMFVIICVVLRLFSRARWRENRTIFNTPNPRLMNVSLLRDSKLLHGQERRGSRAPSRAPSLASLRPHSPHTHQDDRRNSHASSNASAVSTRSNMSPTTAHAKQISPMMESVTVEVQEPKP